MQQVSVGARIPYSWCLFQQAVLSLLGSFQACGLEGGPHTTALRTEQRATVVPSLCPSPFPAPSHGQWACAKKAELRNHAAVSAAADSFV